MRIPEEGERLHYRRTGQLFEVRKITERFVILYSSDGETQVMIGKMAIAHSFAKIRPDDSLLSAAVPLIRQEALSLEK